jgi:hypothetical protein
MIRTTTATISLIVFGYQTGTQILAWIWHPIPGMSALVYVDCIGTMMLGAVLAALILIGPRQ